MPDTSTLKHALITPRLKKPSLDREDKGNYRPVSNLSFISKVLERAVADQLMAHLDHNALHEVFQSAYRPRHSTETALLRVHDDLICAINHHEVVILVLIDLSAAFDTVNHVLLHEILRAAGVTGTALQWFSSYLSHRTQEVVVGGVHSSASNLMHLWCSTRHSAGTNLIQRLHQFIEIKLLPL